jgi:hypothetical protein
MDNVQNYDSHPSQLLIYNMCRLIMSALCSLRCDRRENENLYIPHKDISNVMGAHNSLTVEVEVTFQLTVGQSASMTRYRVHSETYDHILLSVRRLLSESCCIVSVGRPL